MQNVMQALYLTRNARGLPASARRYTGIKTIARDMNLSRSTVKRALVDLEQHGYLAKLPRYRPNGSSTSNLYTLK